MTWVNFPAIRQLSAPVYDKECTMLGLQKAIWIKRANSHSEISSLPLLIKIMSTAVGSKREAKIIYLLPKIATLRK